jgi:hypothetical protein
LRELIDVEIACLELGLLNLSLLLCFNLFIKFLALILPSQIRRQLERLCLSQRDLLLHTGLRFQFVEIRHRLCMKNRFLIRNVFSVLILRIGSHSFDISSSKIKFFKSNFLMLSRILLFNFKELVIRHFTSLKERRMSLRIHSLYRLFASSRLESFLSF